MPISRGTSLSTFSYIYIYVKNKILMNLYKGKLLNILPPLTRMITPTINLINDTFVMWVVGRSLNVGNVVHCGWWLNFAHKLFALSLA